MYASRVGDGYPIVYLHGWGCDGGIFAPVVKLLPDYANIVFDLSGFGNSSPPPASGWGVTDYAQCLYAAVRRLQLQRFTIVAHSFGCRVAMVFAATYPQYVDGMIFVAPAGLRKFSLTRQCKVLLYKVRKRLAKAGLCQLRACGSDDYRNCTPALKNTFVKVINRDLSRYARKVRCPVLIVNGDADTATPLRHAARLRRLIKNCALVQISGDHFAFFRTPDAFAQTIRNFVE